MNAPLTATEWLMAMRSVVARHRAAERARSDLALDLYATAVAQVRVLGEHVAPQRSTCLDTPPLRRQGDAESAAPERPMDAAVALWMDHCDTCVGCNAWILESAMGYCPECRAVRDGEERAELREEERWDRWARRVR